MQYKQTKKLFYGTYQYKLVLVCVGAGWFRNKDWDYTANMLSKVDIAKNAAQHAHLSRYNGVVIRTKEDLDYALNLLKVLRKLDDIDLRVESPWISLYTNTEKNIDVVTKIDESRIKYVCVPTKGSNLQEGTIILPKVDFEYRVTMGRTLQNYSTFVNWADTSTKLKLTKTCRKQLSSPSSWGGSYFYVTGDKNLMMTKMHLGGTIAKIERVAKN
jgi:hypothetical protein